MATTPVDIKTARPQAIADKRKLKDQTPIRRIVVRPVRRQIVYEFRHGSSVAYLGRRFGSTPATEGVLREHIDALEVRLAELEGRFVGACLKRAA